ncbi:putative holliday junction DNA helicase RuvA [Bacillus phage Kirov]|uniref:Putative holliday junction DNA helicase RuvA n=1 Tax=Bacillus phage Kirov TaxID=2783539 RepID=A0A7U3NKK1_9CAUD|nr:putative holliday junction DNA helicase RuvA [Bacillus phage Kirov]QOV08412.1 putative holliday junction DNA helicase RuvA [Bacillus phage Kirov]
MTYRETMEAFQEALALGYTPREALRDLEDCVEANTMALEELRMIVKYGV